MYIFDYHGKIHFVKDIYKIDDKTLYNYLWKIKFNISLEKPKQLLHLL